MYQTGKEYQLICEDLGFKSDIIQIGTSNHKYAGTILPSGEMEIGCIDSIEEIPMDNIYEFKIVGLSNYQFKAFVIEKDLIRNTLKIKITGPFTPISQPRIESSVSYMSRILKHCRKWLRSLLL